MRNPQRIPPMVHVCPEHIKVNVRSLLHSIHSHTVEETKYTYGIIRRHINDVLSHQSAQNSPHERPSYLEGRCFSRLVSVL